MLLSHPVDINVEDERSRFVPLSTAWKFQLVSRWVQAVVPPFESHTSVLAPGGWTPRASAGPAVLSSTNGWRR